MASLPDYYYNRVTNLYELASTTSSSTSTSTSTYYNGTTSTFDYSLVDSGTAANTTIEYRYVQPRIPTEPKVHIEENVERGTLRFAIRMPIQDFAMEIDEMQFMDHYATPQETIDRVWRQWAGQMQQQMEEVRRTMHETARQFGVVGETMRDARDNVRNMRIQAQEAERAQRIAAQEAARVKKEAEEKAEERAQELLGNLIGKEQLDVYIKTGRLYVKAHNNDYIIKRGGGIIRVEKDKVTDICVHLRNNYKYPKTDNVIALKTMLENDERKVLKIGNHSSRRDRPAELPMAACM